MTNIDREALRETLTQTFGLDWNSPPGLPDGAEIAEDCTNALAPLLAAAVDAARAEGYEQGKAAVREAVEAVVAQGLASDYRNADRDALYEIRAILGGAS